MVYSTVVEMAAITLKANFSLLFCNCQALTQITLNCRVDQDDHKKVHFRVHTPQGSSNSGFDPSIVAHKINTGKHRI